MLTTTLLAVPLAALSPTLQQPSAHLRVDAFGYRPTATKTVVLRQAVQGFDAPDFYAAPSQVQVRRVSDGSLVFVAPVVPWNGGAVNSTSGDRAWHADFTGLQALGDYYVLDPASGEQTEAFSIRLDPYADVRRAAVRTFFYQRCGLPKSAPFAEPGWTDAASHLGPQQDTDCRWVLNPTPGTSRDLRGGWFDAGDYNKYVNYTDRPIHDLLSSYSQAPGDWTDDLNLPESGNGIPDILDEVRVGLDWFLRMQEPNGSLLHKVSVLGFSASAPPSTHTAVRRYGQATASATISGAGAFAHGAVVFGRLPDAASQAYAATLEQAALEAWSWLVANPSQFPSAYNNAGFDSVNGEDSPSLQVLNRARSAMWLYQLTGEAQYRARFDADVQQSDLLASGFTNLYQRDLYEAFLEYTELPGATPSVVQQIRSGFSSTVGVWQFLNPTINQQDPYQAFLGGGDYIWGSNRNKADVGVLHALLNEHGMQIDQAGEILTGVEGYARYLHGVNPLGLTYLTNLSSIGAPNSIQEVYHGWFYEGTQWDNAETSQFGPAPGFMSGGPNANYAPALPGVAGPSLTPPLNQPQQKSYKDWNADWPEVSWQVTEPQISYQSSYIRLLSFLGPGGPASLGLGVESFAAGQTGTIRVAGAQPGESIVLLISGAQGNFELTLPGIQLDLGLALGAVPSQNLLALGAADASGRFTLPIPLASSVAGADVLLQGASLSTPVEPRQTAVRRVIVQP